MYLLLTYLYKQKSRDFDHVEIYQPELLKGVPLDPESYLEPSQTSKRECFAKLISAF